MPEIIIETRIKSSIEICFDLSRSIDLHKISTAETNEKAIGGITNGLINLNEFVTWQATHFGIKQKLTSKITKFESPNHFRDEQQKGIFKFLIHDHYFESQNGITIMKDIFNFQSSFGFLGIIFDKYVLTKYLTKLLIQRNKIIKEFAETQKWKTILNG
jgi:ligand-binding SRPBCC domain-containing protein